MLGLLIAGSLEIHISSQVEKQISTHHDAFSNILHLLGDDDNYIHILFNPQNLTIFLESQHNPVYLILEQTFFYKRIKFIFDFLG